MSEVLSRVVDARARGDYAQAREFARAADENAEPGLLIELGRLEDEVGHHEASGAAFERALNASPHALRGRAAAGLVRARRAQGRTREAQELAIAELARVSDSSALFTEAGDVAAELGDLAAAETHLRRAVDCAADDEQRAKAKAALGNLFGLQGNYEEAEALLREALALAGSATGPMSIEASTILNNLGVVLQFSDSVPEGQELFERALTIVERALGADAEPAATIHHNLARMLRAQHKLQAALPHARRAVQIHAATLGPDHINTALDKAALAEILDDLGELEEAEVVLREAIVNIERELGPGRLVAVKLNNLAALVARRGDNAEAEAFYRRSLAIKESFMGPRSPALAASLNNLAVLLKRTGNFDEARELYERAIGTLDGKVEPDERILQSTSTNLAALVRDTSKPSNT